MAGVRTRSPDGLRPSEQLDAVRVRIRRARRRARPTVFTKEVAPALEAEGIVFSDWTDLDDDDRKYLVEVFQARVFPVLTPLGGRPRAPVPVHLEPLAQPRGPGRRPRRPASSASPG